MALASRWLLTWLSPRRLNPVWLDSVSCPRSSNPDWQISRIRLSEKTHALAHGRLAIRWGNCTRPYTDCREASGKRL